MNDVHEGGCLCGAVRYRVMAAPERHVWMRSAHDWLAPPAGVPAFPASALPPK